MTKSGPANLFPVEYLKPRGDYLKSFMQRIRMTTPLKITINQKAPGRLLLRKVRQRPYIFPVYNCFSTHTANSTTMILISINGGW